MCQKSISEGDFYNTKNHFAIRNSTPTRRVEFKYTKWNLVFHFTSIDFMRFLYMSGLTKGRICGILREHVINLLPVYI